MPTEIRNATENDVPAIVRLMRDFAEFEKLLDHFQITEGRLADVLFGRRCFVKGLIAAVEGKAVGYAIFYPYFASFSGQTGLYLEDLYVEQPYRGRGIGEALIRRLAAIAKQLGHERIDFEVLDWNAPAIRFYEKIGAVSHLEYNRHYKFAGDAFEELARTKPPE